MSFTPEQIASLSAPLDRSVVKKREQGGRMVSYVEGYHVENEANRIFGFDAWDRQTLELRQVAERERKIGKGQYEKDGWGVSYVAKVRVSVRAGDTVIIREGIGAGHGIDADLGAAHESAVKEAETDAEKRALKTFGNPFGQALYDKAQTQVAEAVSPAADFAIATMRTCANAEEFKDFWAKNKDRLKEQLTRPEYERVVAAMQDEAKRFAPPKDTPPEQLKDAA